MKGAQLGLQNPVSYLTGSAECNLEQLIWNIKCSEGCVKYAWFLVLYQFLIYEIENMQDSVINKRSFNLFYNFSIQKIKSCYSCLCVEFLQEKQDKRMHI